LLLAMIHVDLPSPLGFDYILKNPLVVVHVIFPCFVVIYVKFYYRLPPTHQLLKVVVTCSTPILLLAMISVDVDLLSAMESYYRLYHPLYLAVVHKSCQTCFAVTYVKFSYLPQPTHQLSLVVA
jgi:hypothetical protein